MTLRSIAARTGTVGGVLFFVHISIPNCGSYPFIWPALAGAVAFWRAGSAAATHRLRHGMLGTLATGVIVGLIGLVGISLVVFIAGHSQFSTASSASGLYGRLLVVITAETTIATLCALAVGVAILGALPMILVMWLRDRRAGAPEQPGT